MKLDLRSIINVSGAEMPFDYDLDLTEFSLWDERPFTDPVHVCGKVQNRAGVLFLEGKESTVLSLKCDRCLKLFRREKNVDLDFMVTDHLDNEHDDDDIVLMDGTELDLDQIATDEIVLAMDMKNLCSEDCKGLCPTCGADLNLGKCKCKATPDPRWGALAKFLEKDPGDSE